MIHIQENGEPLDDIDPNKSEEYLVSWEVVVRAKGGHRGAALEAFRILSDKREKSRCFVVTRTGGGDPVILDIDQDI